MHTGKSIGWTDSRFSDGLYPYGVKNENAAAKPAEPPNPTTQVKKAGAAEKSEPPGSTAREEAKDVAPAAKPTPKAKRNSTATKQLAALREAAPGISQDLQNILNGNQKLGGVSGRGSFKAGALYEAIKKP